MGQTNLILAVDTSSRIGSAVLARGDKMLGERAFSAPLKHSAEIFPAICELLSRFEMKPDQIEQVYISGGPGSFTGLRIAVTLAKTMHLATGVKIVSVDTLDVVAANVINLTDSDSWRGRPALEAGVQTDMHVLIDRGRDGLDIQGRDALATADYERVAVVVDAKRGQFFIAVYEKSRSACCVLRSTCSAERRTQNAERERWSKVVPDCLMRPEKFIEEFAASDKDIWLLGDGLLYYKDRFHARGVRFFGQNYWSPRAGNVYLLGREIATKGGFADPLTLVPNYLRRPDVKLKPV